MPARPIPPRVRQSKQKGVMLLEALIAILIFSIGILGIVGLQATAVKQSTDARYRAEAALLAEQLMAQMWISNREVTSLQTRFNTCGSGACPGFQAWLQNVRQQLPGITDSENVPEVEVRADGVVAITLYWQPPNEQRAEPYRFQIESQIGQ